MGQYKKEILGLKNTLAKIITRQVKREFLAEKITARERPKDKSEKRLRNKAHEGIGGTGEQGLGGTVGGTCGPGSRRAAAALSEHDFQRENGQDSSRTAKK